MQRTVETSILFQHRLTIVPGRMRVIEKAIKERDFDEFAKVTVADSNQFHAVCLDTSPPIFYLNDVSRSIIQLIEEINRASLADGGGYIAAYTFDAGPNAVIYALERNMPTIIAGINWFFPTDEPFSDPFEMTKKEVSMPKGFEAGMMRSGGWEKGAVKSLIHTRVGDGPRRLEVEASLLGEDGMPRHVT